MTNIPVRCEGGGEVRDGGEIWIINVQLVEKTRSFPCDPGGIKVDWWTGFQHLPFTLPFLPLYSAGAIEFSETPPLAERGSFSLHFFSAPVLICSRAEGKNLREDSSYSFINDII